MAIKKMDKSRKAQKYFLNPLFESFTSNYSNEKAPREVLLLLLKKGHKTQDTGLKTQDLL